MLRKRVLSTVLTALFAALPLIATPAVASSQTTEASVQASLDQELAKRAAMAPAAVHGAGTRLCYTAMGEGYEYQDARCQNEVVGTVGLSQYMSGIAIWVA
jgi:hypothetical protein